MDKYMSDSKRSRVSKWLYHFTLYSRAGSSGYSTTSPASSEAQRGQEWPETWEKDWEENQERKPRRRKRRVVGENREGSPDPALSLWAEFSVQIR